MPTPTSTPAPALPSTSTPGPAVPLLAGNLMPASSAGPAQVTVVASGPSNASAARPAAQEDDWDPIRQRPRKRPLDESTAAPARAPTTHNPLSASTPAPGPASSEPLLPDMTRMTSVHSSACAHSHKNEPAGPAAASLVVDLADDDVVPMGVQAAARQADTDSDLSSSRRPTGPVQCVSALSLSCRAGPLLSHTNARTRMHARMHAHTHIRTHAHTHIHTLP
jgi:hypothetical protein